MDLKAIFRRYSLASYFSLAFLISWGGSFVIAGPKFMRGEAMQFADAMRMGPLVLAGPIIAGILSTYLVDGKEGIRDLFERMRKWRVDARWYAAAILIFPVLILAVLMGLTALGSTSHFPGFFRLESSWACMPDSSKRLVGWDSLIQNYG